MNVIWISFFLIDIQVEKYCERRGNEVVQRLTWRKRQETAAKFENFISVDGLHKEGVEFSRQRYSFQDLESLSLNKSTAMPEVEKSNAF